MITNSTTATLIITIRLLVLAASLIPFTKIQVTIIVMITAGRLNAKDPVYTYWYRYGEKGQKEELTTIQRTLAYGLYTTLVPGVPNTYEGHFLAYRKRKFMVKQDPSGDPIALFPINGKMQILKRVFVSVDESKFVTTVNYIELFGKDPVTGKDVYERFKP